MASKVKITLSEGEILIAGNREGLKDLADICYSLSQLSDEQASTPANHWHIDEFLNTAEAGSVPAVILLKRDWPDTGADPRPDPNIGSKQSHPREIDPGAVYAFCILGPVPPPLSVKENKIYKVQSSRKWEG